MKGEPPADWKPDTSGLWDPDRTSRESFVSTMESLAARGMAQPQDFGELWDRMKAKKDADRGHNSQPPEPPARRPSNEPGESDGC